MKRYNPDFIDTELDDVKLTYRSGQMANNVPGTRIPFTVQCYKEDLGVGYHAIVLYLLEYAHASSEDDTEDLPLVPGLSSPIKTSTVSNDRRVQTDNGRDHTYSKRDIVICPNCNCTKLPHEDCMICTQNEEFEESRQKDSQRTRPLPETPPPLSPTSLRQQRLSVLSPDLNNSVVDDEVVIKKFVQLHRLNIKIELIQLFKGHDILTYELDIQLYDANGNLEQGHGIGVVRETFCTFFEDFFISNATGREEKVPTIRHDMARDDWQAVARILVYLIKRKIGYFPLALSSAFLLSTIFGEENVSNDHLLSSFKNYISLDEKDLLNSSDFDEIKDDLISMLSDYNCKRLPTKETLNDLMVEIAHAELIQKPRYISNCFGDILSRFRVQPFDTVASLQEFYKKKIPSTKNVIKCLVARKENEEEVATYGYLTKFLKSLDKKDLGMFLRFVTGGDLMPDIIEIEFVSNQQPRMPRAQTCSSVLMISSNYSCFNELSEELTNILKSPEAFGFSNV